MEVEWLQELIQALADALVVAGAALGQINAKTQYFDILKSEFRVAEYGTARPTLNAHGRNYRLPFRQLNLPRPDHNWFPVEIIQLGKAHRLSLEYGLSLSVLNNGFSLSQPIDERSNDLGRWEDAIRHLQLLLIYRCKLRGCWCGLRWRPGAIGRNAFD